MAFSIQTKKYLREHNLDSSSEYIKQIYKRNASGNPPPVSPLIENQITRFEKLLKESSTPSLKNTTTPNYPL
jgi:hypothetical protein